MEYKFEKFDKYTLLNLQGDRLINTVAAVIKSEIFKLFNEEGSVNLIIDMSSVKYVDSSGLSVLLIANRLAEEAGGMLVLAGLNDQVRKIIDICRLGNIFNMLPTVTESIEAVFLNRMERELREEQNGNFDLL